MDRDTVSKIGWFLGGLAAGTLLGILFAPASGKETRSKIKTNFKRFESKAKEKIDEIKDIAKSQIEKIKGTTKDSIEKGKNVFEKEKGA